MKPLHGVTAPIPLCSQPISDHYKQIQQFSLGCGIGVRGSPPASLYSIDRKIAVDLRVEYD